MFLQPQNDNCYDFSHVTVKQHLFTAVKDGELYKLKF